LSALADGVRRRWEAGRGAWPAVTLAPEPFAAYLAERASDGELPGEDRAPDLYLACACALGDAAALAAFDKLLRSVVARVAWSIDPSDAFRDDVAQALAERLLAAADGRPRIAEYLGRASLRGWLASAARRTALNLRRGKDAAPKDDLSSSTVGVVAADLPPDVALLKARFKHEFEETIRAALAKLPSRDRKLVVAHLVGGQTLVELAAKHGVARATVARWYAAARDALHELARRELRERLRLSSSEYESALALVRSQIDVNLAEVVSSSGPAPGRRV
jgi:RNA polymerase sigma-70 factor (ECF subfamily)